MVLPVDAYPDQHRSPAFADLGGGTETIYREGGLPSEPGQPKLTELTDAGVEILTDEGTKAAYSQFDIAPHQRSRNKSGAMAARTALQEVTLRVEQASAEAQAAHNDGDQ